jgi:hypothetical protein
MPAKIPQRNAVKNVVFLNAYQLFTNIFYLVGMALGMKNYESNQLKPGGFAKNGHVAGCGQIQCLYGFAQLFPAIFK